MNKDSQVFRAKSQAWNDPKHSKTCGRLRTGKPQSQWRRADLRSSQSDEASVTAAAFVMTLSLLLFVPLSSNFRFNSGFCQLERFSDEFTIVCCDTQTAERELSGRGQLSPSREGTARWCGGVADSCLYAKHLLTCSISPAVAGVVLFVTQGEKQW